MSWDRRCGTWNGGSSYWTGGEVAPGMVSIAPGESCLVVLENGRSLAPMEAKAARDWTKTAGRSPR